MSTPLASPPRSQVARFGLYVLVPVGLYFALFCLLTWPLVTQFSTHYYADGYDGLQNVWNIWWVNQALTRLGQLPWHTSVIHYPYGVSLLGHTLNPINGLLAIPLLRWLSLTQAHNTAVILAFGGGGWTMFLLAYYVMRKDSRQDYPSIASSFEWDYVGALVAGGLFTFANYHFAHAEGHLQMVTLEFIPLFLLLWLRVLETADDRRWTTTDGRPPTEDDGQSLSMVHRLSSIVFPLAAAFALWLVLLSDLYYFLYCVMAGTIILVWWLLAPTADEGRWTIDDSRSTTNNGRPMTANNGGQGASDDGQPFFVYRPSSIVLRLSSFVFPLVVFTVAVLVLCGPLVVALLRLDAADPLVGAHPVDAFSTDLLAPIVYGGHWRFAWLTEAYWSALPGNIHESSVYLGLVTIILVAYTLVYRAKSSQRGEWNDKGTGGKFSGASLPPSQVPLWTALLLVFFILSLGPTLQVWGQPTILTAMPYAWFELVFPPLHLSGVPVRMMVMVTLCAALLAGIGYSLLLRQGRVGRVIAILLVPLMLLEAWPKPLPATPNTVPDYVEVIAAQPPGAVIDLVSTEPQALLYQTVHGHPLAFGYIARVPESTLALDTDVFELLDARDCAALRRDFDLRYLVAPLPPFCPDDASARQLWDDGSIALFELIGE